MTEKLKNTRRAALRLLYAADLSNLEADEAIDNTLKTLVEDHGDDTDWEAAGDRARGVLEQRDEIDEQIRSLNPSWRIERMAAVDRNLLRLGIYEILEKITAPLIAINACVELAKEFGAASTPGFINGLLDQLCQDHDIPIDASQNSS